jgi:hypothetical protein
VVSVVAVMGRVITRISQLAILAAVDHIQQLDTRQQSMLNLEVDGPVPDAAVPYLPRVLFYLTHS